MNEISVLLNPFRSMNEACIPIYIKSNYEIEDCFCILKKYFGRDFHNREVEFFFKRVLVFPDFFPLNYIQNYQSLHHNISKCCDEAKKVLININRPTCVFCKSPMTDLKYTKHEAQLYFYANKSNTLCFS
jgi:hypothetical protein